MLHLPSLNLDHFNVLREAPLGREWLADEPPQNWARSVPFSDRVIEKLPEERFTRKSLKAFIAAHPDDPEVVFVSVMAWGGMRRDHASDAISSKDVWLPLMAALTHSESRLAAYDRFIRHRKDRKASSYLRGVGVAYFTKLLFFVRPTSDAYIMDQWTGKSINLLFGDDATRIVKFDSDVVSNRNSPDDYERFCQCVEALAPKLGSESASEAEARLFSSGGGRGRKRGAWRQHVVDHDAR